MIVMTKEITSGSNFSLEAEREAETSRLRQKMRGFFDRLTPEQEEAVLAYDGDDNVVDPLEPPAAPQP